MSSDPKLSEKQPDAQVSKLVFGAIKSLKRIHTKAVLQYLRSQECSYIDATDVERCLEIAHAQKMIVRRKTKNFKLYRLSSEAILDTDQLQMEIEDERSDKSDEKCRKTKLKAEKNANSSKKSEEKAEGSNTAETKKLPPEKSSLFCDLCKVPVQSKKNLAVHNNGKKHKNALSKKMEKERKKNMNASISSDKTTEKMDTNENYSSNAPSDFQYSNPSGSSHDLSNRKKSKSQTESKDNYSSNTPSDIQHSYGSESSHNSSNRKKGNSQVDNYGSSDFQYSNHESNHKSSNKKGYSRDYRNSYSKPISPSDNSSNRREPYYSNKNHYNRNDHWNQWPQNQSFRNGPNRRLQSFNHYNTHDQNYYYNQHGWVTEPMFSNWADMDSPENNDFFSNGYQSENIQPENFHSETHSSNKKTDEIKKPSIDEQKSPSKKPVNVASDKKAKRSPRVQIKVIPKTTTASEDIQNQSGSEKGVVLSENMTGKRLAHWINPSNQKDQAEIRRLVTEFSKSKKKENLIKLKLHADKVTLNNDSNQSAVDEGNSLQMTSEVSQNKNPSLPSTETVVNVLCNSPAVNFSRSSKRPRSSSFTNVDVASSANSPSSRNRSESLTIDKNTIRPLSCHIKRSSSNPSESPSSRKRKDSTEFGSNPKKHRCSSAECLEKCIESAVTNTDVLMHSERTESTAETAPSTVNTASKDFSLQKEQVHIKKEMVDEMDSTQLTSLSLNEFIQNQTNAISSCQDDASLTPVESLINLFATGNITIKKEFDDPLIDAIRSIDPALLNKVCEDQSDDINSTPETAEKVLEPVIAPSPAVPDSSPVPPSSAPSLTLSLKNIINELQIISEEEEKVKDSLLKADQQIQHYQAILDEWKTKKIKFQSEEEILRNKRNTLVKTMNDLVVQQSSEGESKSERESPVPEERPPSNLSQSGNEINNTVSLITTGVNPAEIIQTENISSTALQQDTPANAEILPVENSVKVDSEDDIIPIENDDVIILPLPKSRIPVIDLDQVDSHETIDTNTFSKNNQNTDSISANCHKIRNLVAHNAVINSIQVFDDYLYTCANDKTAKRFSLKDPTEVVTYRHGEKNIYHLFVEKMRGKTYVFTGGFSSNLITVFDAQSAQIVKVYQYRPNIAGMCKGRSKIYVGLRNGCIATCDWKDQKELVNIEEPIRSIATTHQGGINILITLSTQGHVSVRDADRNGLLIKYVKALNHVPLFMSIYNDWVYLSSAGYLSVLDLSTGIFVKKYELPAAYTSLTVYKDHIFTTSFSGFVRCYSKYDIKDVKAYYGAGRMALTCVNAHDGWIFTGNRTGEVSVFKFDPETALPCQFGRCEMVFARIDDLMYHVLQGKDHSLISMKTCLWRECKATIKRSWDQEAIQNHIRAHITASFPYLHQPM